MEELIEEIIENKNQNFEQLLLISYYSITNYLISALKYGFKHVITKKNIEILRKYLSIFKEENLYLKILFNNCNCVCLPESLAFLDKLDEVNEKTILYFYEAMDDLEDAIYLGNRYRMEDASRHFKFITEDKSYREDVVRLVLGENVVKDYFNYPLEFWTYLDKRTYILDEDLDDDILSTTGVNIRINSKNLVEDLRIFIPRITDLKTLLINIHEINHAYLIYEELGREFIDLDYEEIAKNEEKRFLEEYFIPNYN